LPATRRRYRAPVVASLAFAITACSSDATSPSTDVAFVVEDIPRFWEAVDAGGTPDAFQTRYLARASSALQLFAASRQITGTSLNQMVRAYPRYFAAIRDNTLALGPSSPVISSITENFTQMRQLYARSVAPRVTFVIGRFSTGGTVTSDGIVIGTEFYSTDAATPLNELASFQRVNVKPSSALPAIIAHEHTHVLQLRHGSLQARARTLLERSLLEGSADFIGELAAGTHINGHIHAWANPREAAVWQDFQSEMNGTDISRWLYNQQTSTPDRPGDLGYFVGYRIAKAYYDRAPDKTAAIREIIEVGDAQGFLLQSGYAPR
jgi:hypothetical protein